MMDRIFNVLTNPFSLLVIGIVVILLAILAIWFVIHDDNNAIYGIIVFPIAALAFAFGFCLIISFIMFQFVYV